MKILYLTERFAPFVGGIESMSKHLLTALVEQGHKVQIVTSQCANPMPEVDDWQGIPLFRLPMLTSLTNRDIKGIFEARARLRQIKREFAPEIAHIQFSGPSVMFHWDTQDQAPIPTLVTVHSVAAQVVSTRSLYLDTVRRADWTAPVSRHMLDWTVGHAPEISGRSSVVYNGIPELELPAIPTPLRFDPPMILWVGRMVDWKRVDRLIEAFSIVAADHLAVRLCLAGDGPERGRLEAMARDHGVADRTEFVGWVGAAQRSQLMQQATVVAIPSEAMENLPMVALEAGGQGRPIVGSRVSGLPEIVEHGRSGLLLDDIEPVQLAKALARILEDQDATRAMGQAASQLVHDRFTCARMVHDYVDIYQRLIRRDAA